MDTGSVAKKQKAVKNRAIMLCFYKTEQLASQVDNIELSDYTAKMKKMYRYRDIPRSMDLEEEKLRKAQWCEAFKAKIAPQVCLLRRKYDTAGYCSNCRGARQLSENKE